MNTSWTISDLEKWDNDVCDIAKAHDLDWFPIRYEVCDYYSMIGHMAYHGMPTHYGHWSYGKSFEQIHQRYNAGMEGLPYELIINSNPSIAYLMKENPEYLQVLIMAHCVGHSDFFKNNATFANTSPENIVARLRNAKKRIQAYVEDPTIGVEKVEEVLTAAHAVQFQMSRSRVKRSTREEKVERIIKDALENDITLEQEDIEAPILEPEYDILMFCAENSRRMPAWKRDLLEIVNMQAEYFIPQIQTKIMNEGWASFWHYRLMHKLNLPDKMHLAFLKMHNLVIRPHTGGLNPYHLGFELFKRIEEAKGIEECFIARETLNDASFLMTYLTQKHCDELGLFSYSLKRKKGYLIDDVSDDDGWKSIRSALIAGVGTNSMPVIYADDLDNDFTLHLRHEHDGRDLDLDYADKVINHIKVLWGDEVKLRTIVEEEPWEF